MWIGAQGRDGDTSNSWPEAFRRYAEQFAEIKGRLGSDELLFFDSPNIHDGELLALMILDASRPAPIDGPPSPWNCDEEFPVDVTLSMIDAVDEFVWTLRYDEVRSIVADYPSSTPLFLIRGEGFGDWGYDELTDAGDGFLSHEILFSSGSTIHIVFKSLVAKRYSRSEFASEGSTKLFRPAESK